MRPFDITIHVKERYLERTNPKYEYLSYRRTDQRSIDLMHSFRKEFRERELEIHTEIFRRLKNATEERSYLNDSQFMDWYYTKYGYERFQFLVDGDIVFVVIGNDNRVVTCCDASRHIARPKNKFRKKQNTAVG